jgi:hypothetical protein
MIVIPGNQTSITLTEVDEKWQFSLAANTDNGSTGLNPSWLCKYQYQAPLGVSPQLLDVADKHVTEDSILVQWIPVKCDYENKARVISYILRYEDVSAG